MTTFAAEVSARDVGGTANDPSRAAGDRYNGLDRAYPTLPSSSYLERGCLPADLEAIWYRSWIHVCREADIAEPLAYRVFTIGDQEILVLRDETGDLARLSQHLPSPRLAALPGKARAG